MFRRHPIVILFLFLLIAGSIAIGIFLANFDLDRYRAELQQTLGEALDRPVSLGKTQLSWNQGPALAFAEVVIGPTADQTNEISAKHLLIRLDPDALWQGRVKFAEIVLLEPRLVMELGAAPPASETPSSTSSPTAIPLEKILVRSLTVRNGSLLIVDRRGESPHRLEATAIDAQLRGLSLHDDIDLELSGIYREKERTTPFDIKGRLTPDGDLRRWRDCRVDLDFAIRQLAPSPWLTRHAPPDWDKRVSGALSLHGELRGAVNSGLATRLEILGEGLSLHLKELRDPPWPLNRLRLSGTLTRTEQLLSFSDLDLTIDDFSVTGKVALKDTAKGLSLALSLASPPLPLEKIRRLWPGSKTFLPATQTASATLQIASAELAGPLSELRNPKKILAALQTRLLLREARLQPDGWSPLENISVDLSWSKERLELSNGQVSFEGLPLLYAGSLEKPWDKDFPLDLTMTGPLQSQTLLQRVPKKIKGLKVTGPMDCRLELSGTRQALTAKLTADLVGIDAHYNDTEIKASGRPGALTLLAEFTPEKSLLQQGELQLSPLAMKVRGELSRLGNQPFSLNLETAAVDLKDCHPYFPLLQKHEAQGRITLRYALTGANHKLLHHEGVATLHQVGVHLTRVIADINDANGRILLYPDHAESRNLTLKLGGSPLDIEAKVASFKEPAVDIRVKGETVRADDIVFHNDRIFLRRLDGHLRIDRRGITFDPVKIRMDGGTAATVRGAVTNFSTPEVNLDIEASYGNIDEVIALWRRPENAPPPKPKTKNRTRLLITATAHQGQLGNLQFQEARGEITLRQGVLTIFPLFFKVADGYCQGQVGIDSSTGSSSRLTISGHLENFNASAIYRDLLRRKGLVTGVLRGDFHLEGTAGKTFLDTSRGGVFFEVKDGVLRKFRFLAKVFSILNVAQILSLQLPDMDNQGMPFNRLHATATLDRGVLSTNDLLVDSTSMNLSLIGDYHIKTETLDLLLGIKPLRTVDQVVTNIPIAGWLLTGNEKALITVHFEIKGKSNDPEVVPVPITSLSEKVLGIFKRVLGLPGKIVTDVGELFK